MKSSTMATQDSRKYNIDVFWDDEYKRLDYINEPFNDPVSVNAWISQGYQSKITGDLCDMRHQLPSWNQKFINLFESQGWQDVGTAYYRMHTGTVMPTHSDLYVRYVDIFKLDIDNPTNLVAGKDFFLRTNDIVMVPPSQITQFNKLITSLLGGIFYGGSVTSSPIIK